MLWSVYEHKNKTNNKRYIGITSQTVQRRWKGGYAYHGQSLFYNAIQKYGWNNFSHTVIQVVLTAEQAKDLEIQLIRLHQSNNPQYGYNITAGGDGSYGFKRPQSTRDKISRTLQGHKVDATTIEKMRVKSTGKKHTEASKQKISNALKGAVRTEDQKKWLSEVNKKKIVQLDLNNNLVAVHKGIFSVQGYSGQCISLCVRGKLKTHKGFMWRLYNDYYDNGVHSELG